MCEAPIVPRRPSFDRAEVVRRAMEVFWRHGYQGASMQRLGEAMGLKPGSIYAAFESKDGLYREALAAYSAEVRRVAASWDLDARGCVERWLMTEIERARDPEGGGRGCLMLASAAELPELDEGGRRAVQAELEVLERAMRGWVSKARKESPRGDAPAPAATARMLVATLAGISAMSRAGVPERNLKDAARAALALV